MISSYKMEIAEAIDTVRLKMMNAAARAGRKPDDIRLIAVSKTVGLDLIIESIKAGVTILGENRIQEAQKKVLSDELRALSEKIEWHLIGSLQKNKARTAVMLFNLIHSVDSVTLAEELNIQALKRGKKQRVLVQVKLADEASKHGVPEGGVTELVEKISGLHHLEWEGLMTIPPFFDDPEKARPYFRKLKQIADRLTEKGFAANELSMGMSNDFEVAIEEGATMVRVGTAIFGERHY